MRAASVARQALNAGIKAKARTPCPSSTQKVFRSCQFALWSGLGLGNSLHRRQGFTSTAPGYLQLGWFMAPSLHHAKLKQAPAVC